MKKKFDPTVLVLLAPYWLLFAIFILIPTLAAIALSFTWFNTLQPPRFIGLDNYVRLFTQDETFMKNVLPNTLQFAIVAGLGGYLLSFVLAWALAQVPRLPRTILSLFIYAPSLTGGVIISVVWSIVFSGDQVGYLNSLLLNAGLLREPVQFLTNPLFLMPIMMVVTIWGSMGVGFLAMLAGVLNVDPQLYEAGALDGIKNRFQETVYITLPSMQPQMLFGAVMAVVGTFQAGAIGVQLSGQNPTPQNAGQLIVNHIEDYGFFRYEMGYAAAVSVVLLGLVWIVARLAWKTFGNKED
ncbi:MAG: sugar ABC transporter permease [Spirochaetales bacterium]